MCKCRSSFKTADLPQIGAENYFAYVFASLAKKMTNIWMYWHLLQIDRRRQSSNQHQAMSEEAMSDDDATHDITETDITNPHEYAVRLYSPVSDIAGEVGALTFNSIHVPNKLSRGDVSVIF